MAGWAFGGGDYEDIAAMMTPEDRKQELLEAATKELQGKDPDSKIARAAIEWRFESLKTLKAQAHLHQHPEQWLGSTQDVHAVHGPRSTRDKASQVVKRLYELCKTETHEGDITRRLLYMTLRETCSFKGKRYAKRELVHSSQRQT